MCLGESFAVATRRLLSGKVLLLRAAGVPCACSSASREGASALVLARCAALSSSLVRSGRDGALGEGAAAYGGDFGA